MGPEQSIAVIDGRFTVAAEIFSRKKTRENYLKLKISAVGRSLIVRRPNNWRNRSVVT